MKKALFFFISFALPLLLIAQVPELVIPIGHTGPIRAISLRKRGPYHKIMGSHDQ